MIQTESQNFFIFLCPAYFALMIVSEFFMVWISSIKKTIVYVVYLCIAVLVLLELIFQILPTATPFWLAPATSTESTLKFYPNQSTTYSLGKNFYKIVKKQTNNYGFVASEDFKSNSQPGLVIIGDSYVEAMQVDSSDTLGEVLSNIHSDQSVYQLGISGIAMSQYLHASMEYKRI